MGGANSLSAIGACYVVLDLREPLVTVGCSFSTTMSQVMERRSKREKFKEVVAEFKLLEHANIFAKLLESGGVESALIPKAKEKARA